ncbi:alpha/beta hydrolase [Solilutibacter pythonis]|uniref:alpha/beta hydrolase n=1 Tax=Solilutibacter pythonis TaxID=2483112 RepID=UPI001314EFF9|nr:alpha/beta hydrolase [Lysobacter pythonis]
MSTLPDTLERETGPAPEWSVIWLHGLGADGNDFVPIVPELVRPGWPALRFVFPHAPVRPVTINGGMRMRAWYDIREMDLSSRADAEGVAESVAHVDALVARESERGVPPSRVVLAGFSQGGAITLAAGIRRAEPLAGLVALSTYLPLRAATMAGLTDAARRQPVFMAHGMHDPVVPYTGGKHSRDLLADAGFDVAWHAYPMAHQVCGEEIADLAGWLGKRFA